VPLGFVVLLYLGSPMSPGAWARETWSEIGHIQILEGPERIWVFVEVVRITDYTDELFLHLMSKHPDEEIVSRTVFTVDRLGNVTRTAIAKGAGPNLDPDLHPIFRLSDGLYQYDAGSMGRPASVYRWRGDRFSPLDERESKEVKQKLRRVEQADRLTDELLELEAIMERDGWRNLYLHAVGPFLRREGQQDLPRGDAHRPTEPPSMKSLESSPGSRIFSSGPIESPRLRTTIVSSLRRVHPGGEPAGDSPFLRPGSITRSHDWYPPSSGPVTERG
jgi:hypothetical protein